jgi:GNAT superfamily N-acetyltransferase
MTIRQAAQDDWKSIQNLNRQIFDYEINIEPSSNLEFPYTPEAVSYFRKACEGLDNHIAFVCEKDGAVVGYAIAKLIPAQDLTHRVGIRLAQVHTLGVDKAYRRMGIGRQLIATCRDWAVGNGANRLKIVAYAGNEVARSLYSSMDFHEFEVGYEMDIAKK